MTWAFFWRGCGPICLEPRCPAAPCLPSRPVGAVATLPGAAAAAPAPEGRTIAVYATGRARVVKPKEQTNTTVRAAVAGAHDKALPTAIANARGEADKLAAASGLTLGQIVSVEEQQFGVAPFFPYGFGFEQLGTFDPGRFCGDIRRPIFAPRKQGQRGPHGLRGRRLIGFRKRHVCRVPQVAVVAVEVTYAAS
jgi:uncharacterized protein DUF541